MSVLDKGTKKISDGLKVSKLWDTEAEKQLIEFGRQKQSEASMRICDVSGERKNV